MTKMTDPTEKDRQTAREIANDMEHFANIFTKVQAESDRTMRRLLNGRLPPREE